MSELFANVRHTWVLIVGIVGLGLLASLLMVWLVVLLRKLCAPKAFDGRRPR